MGLPAACGWVGHSLWMDGGYAATRGNVHFRSQTSESRVSPVCTVCTAPHVRTHAIHAARNTAEDKARTACVRARINRIRW